MGNLCLSMTGTFIVILAGSRHTVGQVVLSSITGIGEREYGWSTKQLALILSRIQKGALTTQNISVSSHKSNF
jgi:hypothetical protein